MAEIIPRLVVFTTLFPHPGQPNAGLFIRERMFRVGKVLPLTVVAPVPWFPLQGLIRRWRPHFRPEAPRYEVQDEFEVFHPRFFSVPGLFKSADGFFMALCSLSTLLRLKKQFAFNLIDAHFAYPDGYAATLLGRWIQVPVTITLRGTEVPLARCRTRRALMIKALGRATRIFSVADALKRHVIAMGVPDTKIRVVGNGVDLHKFQPIPRHEAREQLGLPQQAPILISVGGLVERKGFHRVIECLPTLLTRFPGLQYLIVGGPSAEGDWTDHLKKLVAQHSLQDSVRFLGPLPPSELKVPLSAADVFVLATSNEGWANVFLEAMGCGLPVVTTRVGGNAEVVANPELGLLVPFGDVHALQLALSEALGKHWNRNTIVQYAQDNSWDTRVDTLVAEFRQIVQLGESAR